MSLYRNFQAYPHHCFYLLTHFQAYPHHCFYLLTHFQAYPHHCFYLVTDFQAYPHHCFYLLTHFQAYPHHCFYLLTHFQAYPHHCFYLLTHSMTQSLETITIRNTRLELWFVFHPGNGQCSNKTFKRIMQNVLIFIQVNDDKIHTRMEVADKLFIHSCVFMYSGYEPMSRRCHTWFEPISDVLAAGVHHHTLDWPRSIDGSCRLRDHGLVPLVPQHALSQFIASISPKLLPLQQFGQSYWQCMQQRYKCPNCDGKYTTIAELKGHKVNMICKENCLFSPRALFRGIPARVNFVSKNGTELLWDEIFP